jgi:hypothetical protein
VDDDEPDDEPDESEPDDADEPELLELPEPFESEEAELVLSFALSRLEDDDPDELERLSVL